MSTRIGSYTPSLEERLRYKRRSSSYLRRPVMDIRIKAQIQPSTSKLLTLPVPVDLSGKKAVIEDIIRPLPKVKPSKSARVDSYQKVQTDVNKKASKKQRTKVNKQTALLYVMASVLFIVGGAVSFSGLRTNHHVEAQVRTLQQKSQSSEQSGNPQSADIPSTDKPASDAVRSYVVAPNMPRYIDIPKLGEHARIVSLGTKADGSLASPGNIYDIGWYNGSSLPGQPGAMLLDGHVSSWNAHGTFYDLKKLKTGDDIKVERGDGKVFTYKVLKSVTYDHQSVDMKSAVVSADPGKPGLNLITCTGRVVPGTNEFDGRLIVYAVQQ